jgi:hypothetical protein
MGGKMADNDQVDTDQEDTDQEDTDLEDTGAEDAESVRTERDKLRMTLEKIKAERKQLRADLSAARKGEGDGHPGKTPDPEDRIRRLAGVSALTGAGLTREQAKVAVRLLDLSKIEIDEDGDCDPDDAVADLKKSFPGLFGTGVRRVTTADRAGRSAPASDPTRVTSERLLKAAGYR